MEFVNPKPQRSIEQPELQSETFDNLEHGEIDIEDGAEKDDVRSLQIQNLTDHSVKILSKYYSNKELTILDKAFTPEQTKNIHTSIMNMSSGAYSSIPRTCLGRRCPSKHACPFIQLGISAEKAIVGKKCPVEVILVEEWRNQYNDVALSNKIDPDNIVIRNYISDLIECDITNMRMNHYIGGSTEDGGGEITENVFVINPKTGDPEYQKTENIALAIKQFVSVRKERAIQALVASPFWQKKFEPKNMQKDDLQTTSDILSKARDLRKEMQLKESSVPKDADYIVIDERDNNMTI
jgi:hypothetical protein